VRRYYLGLLALLLTVTLAPAIAVSARTMADVDREIVPFEFDDVNPCNGEPVTLTGELIVTTRTTVDAEGRLHIAYNLVPSGVRGTGASGAAYKAVGGEREHFNVAVDDAPLTDTFTSVFNLVSQGSTDNFIAKVTFHVTVDANGQETVFFDNSDSECHG